MGVPEAVFAASLPRLPMLRPRAIGLIAFVAGALALLTYMVREVPIMAPVLSREEVTTYWWAALAGAGVVLLGVALVVSQVSKMRRLTASRDADRPAAVIPAQRPLVPRALRFERVLRRAVLTAAAISAVGVTTVAVLGAPLWNGGLALALPFLPLIAIEAGWKFATHGIYAAFALLVLMQVAHMGEHSMQVGQLAVSNGDLASSHGVFGQLDFELVHFVTDTTLWIVLGLLLVTYSGRNFWLWIAFAAASLHQVEHFYLFFIYYFHEPFYSAGGFAGIMGENGMIGSPLDRPYLHFTYNLIIVVPMVLAVWDEARRVDEGRPTA
jgi:hypothetical protein